MGVVFWVVGLWWLFGVGFHFNGGVWGAVYRLVLGGGFWLGLGYRGVGYWLGVVGCWVYWANTTTSWVVVVVVYHGLVCCGVVRVGVGLGF